MAINLCQYVWKLKELQLWAFLLSPWMSSYCCTSPLPPSLPELKAYLAASYWAGLKQGNQLREPHFPAIENSNSHYFIILAGGWDGDIKRRWELGYLLLHLACISSPNKTCCLCFCSVILNLPYLPKSQILPFVFNPMSWDLGIHQDWLFSCKRCFHIGKLHSLMFLPSPLRVLHKNSLCIELFLSPDILDPHFL